MLEEKAIYNVKLDLLPENLLLILFSLVVLVQFCRHLKQLLK